MSVFEGVQKLDDLELLEKKADLLYDNIAGWEKNTLQRIGKRIAKYGKMSVADVQSVNNIAFVKQDMEAITKELAQITGYNISKVEGMYADLLEQEHLANKPLYDYRGKAFVPFSENIELQAIASAYAKVTAGDMVNLSKTKLLCTRNELGRFVNMQKGYTGIMDKAVISVKSGATDFHTAMRESIIQLGGSGVRVDYGAGITRRLDTVVRQNLLWGAKQATNTYVEMLSDELGCDGFEVDYHSNSRPSHQPMQGKQYSNIGAKTVNGRRFESAEYPLRLMSEHGCRHYKIPIICGVSEPAYSNHELAQFKKQDERIYNYGGKDMTGYDITQAQRRIETAIRSKKSIMQAAQASGDKVLVQRCKESISAYMGEYEDITAKTGIGMEPKRMSIPGKK